MHLQLSICLSSIVCWFIFLACAISN